VDDDAQASLYKVIAEAWSDVDFVQRPLAEPWAPQSLPSATLSHDINELIVGWVADAEIG
jgi:hypothetical protein